MPCPLDTCLVLNHGIQQFPQDLCIEAIILRHHDGRLDPELGFVIVFSNMHMNRLARGTLIRVEKEPESPIAKDQWHESPLSFVRGQG